MTLPARHVRPVFQLGNRDERDAPVAGVDQVLRAQLGAAHVVDRNHIAPVLMAADEHDRHVVLEGFAHRPRVAREGQEHDARDSILEERFHPGDLALAVALRVAEHRRVASRGGMPLDQLGHLREERVGEVADHDAEDVGALLDELAGEHVGAVTELVDGRPDSPASSFGDAWKLRGRRSTQWISRRRHARRRRESSGACAPPD